MATPSPTQPDQRGLMASVRSLMPDRSLQFREATVIAERQANRLLEAWSYDCPPFPSAFIEQLPWIEVQVVPSLPASGMSHWSRGMWRIRLNGSEAPTRRRFTLAHELKHVLDAPFEHTIYRSLGSDQQRAQQVEALCDHFAACLLMPKKWVKRCYFQGTQDPAELAWRFEVSPQAMAYRLNQLGLVDPAPRCEGVTLHRQDRRPTRIYRRSFSPAFQIMQTIGAAA